MFFIVSALHKKELVNNNKYWVTTKVHYSNSQSDFTRIDWNPLKNNNINNKKITDLVLKG